MEATVEAAPPEAQDTPTGDGNGAGLVPYQDDTAIVIPGTLVSDYLQAGFKQSSIEGYERDVMGVQSAMARSVRGMVDAGEILSAMKERTVHGGWGFLLHRAGLSDETAERCMAAHRAYQTYPLLAERVDRFAGSTLALIGARKDVTDPAIAEIAELADAGEPTRELVLDIIRDNAPKKDKKPAKHKTFFRLMPAAQAAEYRGVMVEFADRAAGSMANSGANLLGLLKSPDFKAYAKDLLSGGDSVTPLQRALLGLLEAAYIVDHPDSGA